MKDKCPICDVKGTEIRCRVKGGVSVKVYRCGECYLDFLETWDDVERVYQYYDGNNYVFKPNVDDALMKFDQYNELLERMLPYLNSNTRLLDIGCGDGTFLRKVRPHVSEVEGIEITAVHVKNLREEGFRIWDCLLHEMNPDKPYDIICMSALLEHIPKVTEFLKDLKTRFVHDDTQIFIEAPNLLDPLTSCYDVPAYRDFFYREYHLYYFTEKSLGKLLQKAGFKFECQPLLQASLTNHFHWMHHGEGQLTTNDMSNVVLPKKVLMDKTLLGTPFMKILNQVDDFYREQMIKEGIGDILVCRAWL